MTESRLDEALVDRWRTDAGRTLAAEVFRRLRDGRKPDGLPLSHHEGRVDLRGISGPRGLPTDAMWRPALTDIGEEPALRRLSPPALGAVVIESLDFSGAELPSWRWMRTTVLNCRFDGADIEDLGTWATRVEDTSFAGTRGRPRCLGAWLDGQHGVFRRVDFSRADLRAVPSGTADFIDCDFSRARLHGCEWGQSAFVRCKFDGLVRENIWYGIQPFVRTPNQATPKATPNPMEDVDFSPAELRWCDFRQLDLARVKLPENDKHLVIRGDYRRVLERASEVTSTTQDLRYGGFGGVLDSHLDWVHPNCHVGVFHLKDLAESDHGTGAILALLRRVAAEVGATTNL